MALPGHAWSSPLLLWLLTTSQQGLVRGEGFTFPTTDVDEFIVGDLVNVTWDSVSPRISLYEMCATAVLLESNVSNTQSYVWNATRDHYTESGCAFELVSLTDDGSLILPNLTSVPFGVDPRYTNDPAPTSYNFGGTSSLTATATSSATSTSSTNTLSSTTAAANPYSATAEPASATSSSSTSNEKPTAIAKEGLTTAQKVGVGLGVPLGVLVLSLAGAFIFMYRRRQRRGRGDGSSAQLPLPPPQQQHLYHTVPLMAEQPKSPFDGSRMSRLSGAETLIAELPAADVEADSERGDSLRPVSELMGTPRNELI
ncbi:hypothetical protein ASPACDRAFT_58516 [Aspergillus aculeatus ATCC 16872]|uniref:Mid2 domain-containing protein n=1 Tax=Aspergillus aculeatus (strain ATCC 16872 / CBS 172.66 / WB 5094) TaxID=690307 RepID=A0A1L9X157_ASPA1|nr:uncharacterized protein ASPACDRAFT_58516 [Aspergillus aculeatus ATCC 16872]OJK02153.1 hypothetical protein ASPACDRAFT_58516 [Aspergillus aculeatus ATCC 16872]